MCMAAVANATSGTSGHQEDTSSRRPVTRQELLRPVDRRLGLRRLPMLIVDAVALAWRASARNLVAFAACEVLSALALAAQLLLVKGLLSDVIGSENPAAASLVPYLVGIVALTVVGSAVRTIGTQQQVLLGELVRLDTFAEIIRVSSGVPLEAFETPVFHDKLERARRAGAFRPVQMVNNVATFTSSLLACAGLATVLAAMQPLFLVLIAAAAIPLVVATLSNSRAAYIFEYALTANDRERTYLMELLTGRETAKELRAFSSTGYLRERYNALVAERLRELRKFLKRRLAVGLAGTTATAIATSAALASLAWLLESGRVDASTAVAAAMAMWMLSSRLSGITSSAGRIVESSMFLDDYQQFLELGARGLASAHSERRDVPVAFGGLSVEDVTFTYPSSREPSLIDIDLEVRPGEIVALVGENGSGKTTLIKLICQLYAPSSGRILWDGADVTSLGQDAVRDQMTVIFQDYVRYHLPARDNITLGRVDIPAELRSIEDAALRSGAHRFISSLPDGFATRLGLEFEGGAELSTGQWQRLALARAFYRGGTFLVLDEPTASLDPRAEAELFAQMRQLAAGKSVLLVSHRFSSVQSADRIYVMHQGRVVEQGTYDELIAQGGHFAELAGLQASANFAARAL
jgi:ATP-binding cassette, subfamily B, bacterial